MTNYIHGAYILMEGDRQHKADTVIDEVILDGGKTYEEWSRDDPMGKT